jgi:hypothetical protein
MDELMFERLRQLLPETATRIAVCVSEKPRSDDRIINVVPFTSIQPLFGLKTKED